MVREIAVFQGKDGRTASVHEHGKLVIYSKNQGEWNILKTRDFFLGKAGGLLQLRHNIIEVLDFLGECRVFVGRSVAGVPYYEMEKAGLSVWELEGQPSQFLDYIMDKEELELAKSSAVSSLCVKSTDPFGPVETANGCYFISLKEIQANNLGVTSKQALLPFLRKGSFYSLEVACTHVPPWLEAQLEVENLSGQIQRINHEEVRLLITKNTCNQII